MRKLTNLFSSGVIVRGYYHKSVKTEIHDNANQTLKIRRKQSSKFDWHFRSLFPFRQTQSIRRKPLHPCPQLLQCRQLQAGTEDLHGLFQVLHRGQTGGNPNVPILGIHSIGKRRSRRGHGHTGFLTQRQSPLRCSRHGIQAYEVAALGGIPLGKTQRCDLPVPVVGHRAEFWLQNRRVSLHDLQGVCLIFKVTYMPELIDLIVTDLLHTEQAGEILDVLLVLSKI